MTEFEIEEAQSLKGIDRLVTNLGLAAIAVFPTLYVTIITPWHLVSQLSDNKINKHNALTLNPGTYFVLSLILVLLIASSVITPDILAKNGGAIGPRLAMNVAEAAIEGNVWKTLQQLPLFIFFALVLWRFW